MKWQTADANAQRATAAVALTGVRSIRLTDPLRRAHGRTRRRFGPWERIRLAAALVAPVIVGVTSLRKRLGVPPVVALPIASLAPLAVIVATPSRSRVRYAAAGAAYMWLFGVSWEMPADDTGSQRRRLRLDYPLRLDSLSARRATRAASAASAV